MKIQANSVSELLTLQSLRQPGRILIEFEGKKYTYQEGEQAVESLAIFLAEQGVVKGMIVSCMIPNCPEYIFYWLALNRLGAVINPINPQFKTAEAQYILDNSRAKYCLVDEENLGKIVGAGFQGRIFQLKQIQQVIKKKPIVEHMFQKNSIEDMAAILYTSGTSGKPKGVMLSNRTFVVGGESHTYRLNLSCDDRVMLYLAAFYIGGMVYSISGSLVSGATIIVKQGFSASRFWEDVINEEITVFNVVGIIPQILLKNRSSRAGKHKVRVAYGTEIAPDTAIEFKRIFGITLLQSYSLTEAMLGTVNRMDDNKFGSIGKVARHIDPKVKIEVMIVNEVGKPVPDGDIGEIILRSPANMLGYYKDSKATSQTMRDGWVYSGDIGKRDNEGYFYFIDRKKDIIRKAGINISSKEIESIVFQIPEVLEAAVIPVPSPLGGDNIKLFVVPKNKTLNTLKIKRYSRQKMADYKVPDLIEVVEALPKTLTNRVEKSILKRMFKPGGRFQGVRMGLYAAGFNSHIDLKLAETLDKLIQIKEGNFNEAVRLTRKKRSFVFGKFGNVMEPKATVIEAVSKKGKSKTLLAGMLDNLMNNTDMSLDYFDRIELIGENENTLLEQSQLLGLSQKRVKIHLIGKRNDQLVLDQINHIIETFLKVSGNYLLIGIVIGQRAAAFSIQK